jgi:hypothetical protein
MKIKNKYAIVVTDSGFIPGVNGMLNALEYYGIKADFYHIHSLNEAVKDFVDELNNSKYFDNYYSINIEDLKNDNRYPSHDKKKESVWYLKMYRYLFAVYELTEYDAVAIFDADMQIVNDITDYFEIAAKTGRILMPNNDFSGNEYDDFNIESIKGAASPPLHNMPLFFKPNEECKKIFSDIPKISLEGTWGDMTSINRSLIKHNKIKDVMVLPNTLWLQTFHYNIKLYMRKIGGKRFLALSRCGDRLYSFHRRWWFSSICEKEIKEIKQYDSQQIGFNNIKLFWEMTRFFNLECGHKIKWNEKWGEFPKDIKLIEK